MAELELSLRQSLIKTGLVMNRLGINQGTSGNLSVRSRDGLLITPSARPYEQCRPGDIVRMQLDGTSWGRRKPSSEWRLHRDLYEACPEAGAILHAHPPWCTTLACLEQEIPAFHYMIAVAGGDSIPCASYALFGSAQLSENVNRTLQNRTACLMSHHGMVCFAETLEKVLALAVEVENLARVYCQVLQLGKPSILNQEKMDEVLVRFAGYKEENDG